MDARAVLVACLTVLTMGSVTTRAAAQDGGTRDGARDGASAKGPAWAGLLFLDRQDDAAPYLVAESVDPTSPAQTAGLQAGDSIISFSGVPIRAVISNPNRFKPGDKVVVKFRRNGVKELSVTLGVRPSRWLKPQAAMMTWKFNINDLLASSDVMPPFAGSSLGGCNDLPIAGAEVAVLNPDLAAALNAPKTVGLLVLQVARGTPATRAGLRSGDILVRADSTTLDTPLALAKAMRASRDHLITLVVQRAGETRTVKFQW